MNINDKISPMLATMGTPFDDPEWIYEIKWDGSRTLAFLSDCTRLQDRRLVDVTSKFPELQGLNKLKKCKEAILDGELVVLKDGKPHFKSILSRKNKQNSMKIELISKTMPAIFIPWDIIYMNGRSLTDLPLIERKNILSDKIKESESLKISDFIYEKGKLLFEETGKKGLEGVMAKKADSKYYIGKRSSLWLKLKHFIILDAVVMGYKLEKTALVMGLYDEDGNLKPIGSCESGLSKEEINAFIRASKDIEIGAKDGIMWLKPYIAAKVRFMEWSENMKMRSPSFVSFVTGIKISNLKF